MTTPPTQQDRKGFGLFPAIEAFQETFEKGAADSLRRFLVEYPAKKWMVFTDYAFYDPKKNADVFVLSLFPYAADFNRLSSQLQDLSFKDVKDLPRVNPAFISYLRAAPIANIAIFLQANRRLSPFDERGAMVNFLVGLEEMNRDWCLSTPEETEHYKRNLKDLKHIKRLVQVGQVNQRLLRDGILVASITAYVLFRVAQITAAEKIGWFSDRDALLSYQSAKLSEPLVFQLLHTYYHVLCERNGMASNGNPLLGDPEASGPLFYDSFLRVPDLIAGTLADVNFSGIEFSHPKFEPVFHDLLVSNEKNIFFGLQGDSSNGIFEAVRITLDRHSAP